ncbi:hypothetical protein BABINDRAFT_163331 [Babjeviella inositovora NRRL Y-12698]|uniref:Uncharacterized protein n=1 Tax=Babjeviella inositovora NRRL Y-12698 TaxID=984486 RepID=A0A1E3QIQ6_9ASCO|nr:uncharacterized protein BABINDRAFT_163331 [Babjeviella inositovora NRRL Y-12698]ODQ77603.1 hypothetical protein BABINDRAFT_163331 [Babjeviella inositovora NRRL Y-12698]
MSPSRSRSPAYCPCTRRNWTPKRLLCAPFGYGPDINQTCINQDTETCQNGASDNVLD